MKRKAAWRQSIKDGMARSHLVMDATAKRSAIVRLLRDVGEGGLLGPETIYSTRIAEALWRLSEGDPRNAELRRAAAKPLSFVAWVRRHQPLVLQVLAEKAAP